jgi:hypothetical protein
MEMKYDPTSQSLELVFWAALRNDGNRDDMLQGVTAFLEGGDTWQWSEGEERKLRGCLQ